MWKNQMIRKWREKFTHFSYFFQIQWRAFKIMLKFLLSSNIKHFRMACLCALLVSRLRGKQKEEKLVLECLFSTPQDAIILDSNVMQQETNFYLRVRIKLKCQEFWALSNISFKEEKCLDVIRNVLDSQSIRIQITGVLFSLPVVTIFQVAPSGSAYNLDQFLNLMSRTNMVTTDFPPEEKSPLDVVLEPKPPCDIHITDSDDSEKFEHVEQIPETIKLTPSSPWFPWLWKSSQGEKKDF